jgi:hypothetical protein
MRNFTLIITLVMILGIFGCKNSQKKDYVFEEFKSQIEKHGMKIDSVDKTELIYLSKGDWSLKVSLENVRRNYERDKDPKHILDLVETLISSNLEMPKSWADVKNGVYISLFPNDFDFSYYIHSKITDEFSKVYVFSENDKQTWISTNDIKNWKITAMELDQQANNNADALLERTPITFDTIENHKLGLIEVELTSLKGALLFAPTMKEKIRKDFGFPFYAVIPVRDFCYIFSEKDYKFFSERIGKVVVDEYKKSGYPITTEILKFTNKGVESVGKYPVD